MLDTHPGLLRAHQCIRRSGAPLDGLDLLLDLYHVMVDFLLVSERGSSLEQST